MAIEDGLLLDVTPTGQASSTRRTNDKANITNATIKVDQVSPDSTKVTISMNIIGNLVTSFDPTVVGNVSDDQVYIRRTSNQLELAEKNVFSVYTKGANNPRDLSQVILRFDFTADGGKVGGPGVNRFRKIKAVSKKNSANTRKAAVKKKSTTKGKNTIKRKK